MPEQKQTNNIRPIQLVYDLNSNADGSVLYCSGKTKVLCQATIIENTPKFVKRDHGWITAEYSMLPASTNNRSERESSRGKIKGRTAEIQRLIGRSIRACFDLSLLPNITLHIDCDVIQADGGTRTASINGGIIAAVMACQKLQYKKTICHDPVTRMIGAISIGVKNGALISDIDYFIDESCDADINVVMDEYGDIIEVQGTAERKPYSPQILAHAIEQAWLNIQQIIAKSKEAVRNADYQVEA